MVQEPSSWFMKSMGVPRAPLSGLPSGCGYELRSQVGVPRTFSGERRTEREVAVHLQDPASWA